MSIETIEFILVCGIVLIQLWVFIRTLIKIIVFRRIIPKAASLKISKVLVPVSDLESLLPKEILANIQQYKTTPTEIRSNPVSIEDRDRIGVATDFENYYSESETGKTEVNIIESEIKTNYVFDSILFSINNYLIRNRGASSDFNLIKDIVERNTDTIEEDINLSISVPLYLGLMGTMMGIVIGLFNMPDLSIIFDTKAKDIMLNEGISLLIGGVKIAMIASFSGLLLTIINSGWAFKGSRSLIESRKNQLYTFVQIELLPIINQGLASTLESLQRNLLKFNSEFSSSLGQMSGIFDSNTKTIKAQKELLDAIDKTKVVEMTRYNVKVLQQLDISVRQFEKFNHSFNDVNSFVENSQQLVSKSNEFLARTDNLKAIAGLIEDRLSQSQQLLDFLSKHFQHLEDHKQYVSNSIAEIGHSISDTFKELKEHIQNSSQAVKDFTIEELEALKTALSESKTNLGNLEHLSALAKDVSQFKISTASQLERLKTEFENNNSALKSIGSHLEKLNETILSKVKLSSTRKLWKWLTAKK